MGNNVDCPESECLSSPAATHSLAKLSLSEVPPPQPIKRNDDQYQPHQHHHYPQHSQHSHLNNHKTQRGSSSIRQLSRQKQLDEAVDTALQLLLDCDDENRLSLSSCCRGRQMITEGCD